jgi:hypothetical protein
MTSILFPRYSGARLRGNVSTCHPPHQHTEFTPKPLKSQGDTLSTLSPFVGNKPRNCVGSVALGVSHGEQVSPGRYGESSPAPSPHPIRQFLDSPRGPANGSPRPQASARDHPSETAAGGFLLNPQPRRGQRIFGFRPGMAFCALLPHRNGLARSALKRSGQRSRPFGFSRAVISKE